MDLDNAADLLGNNEMPVRQQRWWGLLRTAFYIIFYGSSFALLWFAYYNGRVWLRNWREYNYKKSVRRKYGIPDNNNEPFNVAYAKAAQRRKEMAQRMAQQQASSTASNHSAAESVSSARQEGAGPSVSHRRNILTASDSDQVDPPEASLKANSRTFAPQQKSSSSKSSNVGLQSQAPGTPRVASKAKSDVVAQDFASAPRSQRKRSLEKDGSDESTKKSRNEPVEPIDLNAQDSSMDVVGDEVIDLSSPKPARGAKRQAASDEDIANAGSIGKKAGKRARRQSRKLHETFIGDENDASMDVDSISRGKKRDRTEAESSFGGDDDLAASGRGTKNSRHKRKSNASTDMDAIMEARGTKRSYEVESTLGSDDEVGSTSRSTVSRKRGKLTGRDSISDVSMDGMMPDPACAGRKIGEEWHINGETFKVGPDGRRQRQVLLRKRRSRFSMPEDSQHPDTQAHLEILVETWLNDDDFLAADERGDIFIPEKESKEAKDESPISKAGKQLLWATPQKGSGTPKKAFRNSSLINVGVTTDPFKRPSLTGYAKRISIGADSPITPSTPSPTIRPSKSYSKWEKQDLEAEAMARLRKKLEEEKKVATPPSQKKVSFQLPPSESTASSAAPSIASSTSEPATLPPASTTSKPDAAASTASTPSTSNLFTPPSSTQPAVKGTVPSASTTTANELSHVKPHQPSATSTPKFTSGQGPSGTQPSAASSEAAGSLTPLKPTTSTVPTPNFSAAKTQNASNGAAGTPTMIPFARPGIASNAQTSAPKVVTLGPSGFSFGNAGTAQGGKTIQASQAPSPFAFGKPSEKAASSVPTSFGAPANGSNGTSTVNTVSFGSGSTGASVTPGVPAATSNAPGATPQISFGSMPNKAPESANKSIADSSISGTGSTATAPKFNFGFGSKPTGPSPSVQAPAPKMASSSPFSGSGFPTQSTSATASTPTAGSSAAAPAHKITFGTSGTQPSAASASGPATTSNNGFGGNKAVTAPAQTSVAPASTGAMFNFGASKPPATMTSAPSPFGVTPGSSSSPFDTAAKSSETRSPFGTAPTAFGNTTNSTTMSSSPFGAQARPAGEVPKPLFGFGSGSNATTGTAAAGDKQNNQNNKPAFSFNFGATSTPAFGSSTAIQQNGASATSAFGNAGSGSGGGTTPAFTFGASTKPAAPTFTFGAPAASGNANGSNTGNTNVFGSNNGSSAFGGQK